MKELALRRGAEEAAALVFVVDELLEEGLLLAVLLLAVLLADVFDLSRF